MDTEQTTVTVTTRQTYEIFLSTLSHDELKKECLSIGAICARSKK